VLQVNAARVSVRADGYDVDWDEFLFVWQYNGDNGAHREGFTYDECADHVDQCLRSVSSPFHMIF
jgi:hypothetical protein